MLIIQIEIGLVSRQKHLIPASIQTHALQCSMTAQLLSLSITLSSHIWYKLVKLASFLAPQQRQDLIYADKSRVINHYLLLFYFLLFDLTLEWIAFLKEEKRWRWKWNPKDRLRFPHIGGCQVFLPSVRMRTNQVSYHPSEEMELLLKQR